MLGHSLLNANSLLQSVGVGLSTIKTSISLSHTRTIFLSSKHSPPSPSCSFPFSAIRSLFPCTGSIEPDAVHCPWVSSHGTAVVSPAAVRGKGWSLDWWTRNWPSEEFQSSELGNISRLKSSGEKKSVGSVLQIQVMYRQNHGNTG